MNSSPSTICLNMIVKNESHIIIKTLTNLCEKINFSYWVICDTGSTDNTKELITDFFKEKNIMGELHEHTWKDFGYNRTLALECAYNKTDMVFIFDADDEIAGNLVLPETYDHDGYTFNFGNDVVYIRPLLVNNRKKWRFVGVLHEYLACSEHSTPHKNIAGDYYIVSGRTGNRNQNPNKYIDDANILKNAHYDVLSTDYGLSCRYAFYCAQSYKDSGINYMDDAIEWYKKCLDLNMWLQEKYISCFYIGNLYMAKNDMTNAMKYWYKTIEYDSERIEGIINAINYLTKNEEHLLINALYHRFKNYNKNLREKLFMVDSCYKHQLEYNNSISAYYANDKKSGYECCKQILFGDLVNVSLLKATVGNFVFYIDLFEKEDCENKLRIFYLIDNILSDIGKKNETVESNVINCWNKLFDICRPLLTKPSYFNLSGNIINTDSIIITFTTCKRLDLFKQTVYSMINHWNDIKKINYWFCVDDNSSYEDKNQMQKLFPWIQYYMKTEKEKGHRKSMNIIWDKLNELKPKYWIHMEDDFLFHRKMNYIDEAVNALNSDGCIRNNVKQILFNRNYGEIVDSYNSRGHISLQNNIGNDIVLHNFCEGNFNYINCHYWPHYSFRPSIIDAATILQLGNYDSENQFFEMDYAAKWTKNGFTSAFFNKITCRHIGKLTHGMQSNSTKNAYDLNGERQFDSIKTSYRSSTPIKIVNLERRTDRKEQTIKKLAEAGISDENYEIIKAIDGLTLQPTYELKYLFRDNDFGNRKGVIGCALSHYNLWKRLLDDSMHDYYLIMEDDFTLCSNFKKHIETLKSNNEFSMRDVVFLGYSMFEKNRDYDIYNSVSEAVNVIDLNKELYIGGFFAYSINKAGARKMIEYINTNGIKHGIDYLFKIYSEIQCYECHPQIAFSDWNENGKSIDTDIQNVYDSIDFSTLNRLPHINNSYFHGGRLGNLFIVNMALHFISKKNNLMVEYKFFDKLTKLGIELTKGEINYEDEDTIDLTDENFFNFITGDPINKNISIVNNVWCQTAEFALFLKSYFNEEPQKKNIVNHNKFNNRYNNNNDVFIHVRLGDIKDSNWCQTIDYYNKILENLTFENGYISSDSIDNIICKLLIIKYNLKIINYDEVETIMFGSTCKTLILSSGTYSWLIGLLSYFSQVYYPKIVNKWHGDIFVFENWCEIEYNSELTVEKFIQSIKKDYIFIPNLDSIGNDLYRHNMSLELLLSIAQKDPLCVGFNTLGFFKNKITSLTTSQYFGIDDGIYIKKDAYEDFLQKQTLERGITCKNTLTRVKMLCNWCNSEQLCKEWSNMCESGFRWKNYELVWTDVPDQIDYYVIINIPPVGVYYDPKKTIVFQMEPWVYDTNKPWGVKTWHEWSEPDENKFMAIRGRKTNHHNNAFWQLELTLNDLLNSQGLVKHPDKMNMLSTICSSKYFDEGHIARIDFLKFIEEKNDVLLDIYNYDNDHSFKNYRGPVAPYVNKSKGLVPYKYYFMVENNYESNFITEKLWEPILCECLCFYYGCPNVGDYIDSKAFVLLDMNDFEKSYQIIKRAIEEDWWSDRINIIRKEKEKILNELAFFPTIDKIIRDV